MTVDQRVSDTDCSLGAGGLAALALAWPLAAMWLLEVARLDMMASVAAFLVVPAALLALQRPALVLPALSFSLIIATPTILWVDEIATRNGQWAVSNPLPIELPLIGASVQSFVWAVGHFFASIVAWEFVRSPVPVRWPALRRAALCAGLAWVILACFLLVKQWVPTWLVVPYFYCWFGVTLIAAPVIVAGIAKPKLVRPLIILSAIGIYWKTIYEVAALRDGWWSFPGTFIGWIDLPGYHIPIEEFAFWITLFSPAIAVFWEYWNGAELREGRRTTSGSGTEWTPLNGDNYVR